MVDEKEFKKKHLQMRLIEEQLGQLQKQLETIEGQMIELVSTVQSLQEFSESKQDSRIMVPVINGIFAEAELKNSKDLLVNVGSGVVVKKGVSQVQEMLQKQAENLGSVRENVAAQIQQLAANAVEIEKEMKKIASS